MAYFGVCFINDMHTRMLLNAAIMICDPDEKLPAHITVSGPHESEPKYLPDLPSVEGQKVSVLGLGRFRSDRQATVFLHCGFPSIREVWRKKHFGFNPHITLYDGGDFIFSDKLFNKLIKERLFFNFTSSDVRIRQSIKGQKRLELALEMDFNYIKKTTGIDVSLSKIKKLNEIQRISYTTKLLRNLAERARESIFANEQH